MDRCRPVVGGALPVWGEDGKPHHPGMIPAATYLFYQTTFLYVHAGRAGTDLGFAFGARV